MSSHVAGHGYWGGYSALELWIQPRTHYKVYVHVHVSFDESEKLSHTGFGNLAAIGCRSYEERYTIASYILSFKPVNVDDMVALFQGRVSRANLALPR